MQRNVLNIALLLSLQVWAYQCTVSSSAASTDTRNDDAGSLSMLLTSDNTNDFANTGLPLRV